MSRTQYRALALLAGLSMVAPATATAGIYYASADTSTSVGADGTCNLPAGNSAVQTDFQWKTLMATSGGAATQMRTRGSIAGKWVSMGRIYRSTTYATSIRFGSTPTPTFSLQSTSTSDQWQIVYEDYDPSGATGNGTSIYVSSVFATQNTTTPTGQSPSFLPFPTNVPAITAPPIHVGHRLMVEIFFLPSAAGNVGIVDMGGTSIYANDSSTYNNSNIGVLAENWAGEPPTTSVCPGSAGTYDIDHFVVSTWSNPGYVTGVKVNVSAGNNLIQTLKVTGDDGTVYGSANNPPSGVSTVTVSPARSISSTAWPFRLQMTLASPSLSSGQDYPVAANVSSIVASTLPTGGAVLNPTGWDFRTGGLVVRHTPPANPTWGTNSLVPDEVLLNWTNPVTNYASTVILRSGDGKAIATPTLTDGVTYTVNQQLGTDTVVYVGTGASLTEILTSGGSYTYRIFAADSCKNYSSGLGTPQYTVQKIPFDTTATNLTATVKDCRTVILVATYTGDGDNNNVPAFQRDGSGVTCASLTRVPSWGSGTGTWTCVDDSVPVANTQTTYAYGVSFTDTTGVNVGSPTASATENCAAGSGTLSLAAHPNGPSPATTADPGQTNVLASRLQLTATNASVYVTQLAFTNGGSAGDGDIGTVGVYADTGQSPGIWDSGDQRVASARFSRSANAWIASGFTLAEGTTRYIVTINAAYGAVANRTFALSLTPAGIAVAAPGAVTGTTSPIISGGLVTLSGSPTGKQPGDATSGSVKPMVLILNPANGSTLSLENSPVSKGVRVQVQVYDPSHTSITSVLLSHDGGSSFPDSLARVAQYDSVLNPYGAPYYAGLFQGDLTSILPGSWTLQAQATTAGGGTAWSAPIVITVNPPGSGDGNLLVRDNSAQLCIDCHSVQTHSSQSTASPRTGQSRYGSWGIACRDCHTPHKTLNAQLVRESIVPPAYSAYQPAHTVRFWDPKTGDSGTSNAVSFVTSSATLTGAGTFGPCQVCHTRTSNRSGTPRWRNSTNDDTHFTGSGTRPCALCHSHANGFSGRESQGGEYCGKCHSAQFWNMQAAGTGAPSAQPHLTRHTLGPGILGTNDGFANPSLTWASPLVANAPADRSCVGMCHPDHVHNDPSAWPAETHANSFYRNAATQGSRALTRDATTSSVTYGYALSSSTGSGTLRTDFVPGQFDQGCLACHTTPVDASRPAVSGAGFEASAHDFTAASGQTWEYVLHDDARGRTPPYDSRFQRNCTKCHAGNQLEGQSPSWAGGVQGVHYSDNPSLLSGAVNPAGVPAANVCYGCHGGATPAGSVGKAYANGKNIAALVYHATQANQSGHPSDSSAVHDSVAEAAATFGNPLAGKPRHAGCNDCHDPHQARSGSHAANTAGPALQNAVGARLGTLPAWGTPNSASTWSVVRLQAGTDLEASLCFKCHSAFAWGSGTPPTSPSLGRAYTDQAREFNPANGATGGYHPVLADSSNNLGRIIDLRNLSQGAVRTWSASGRNRMTCSDCHASDQAGDPLGPHGSSVKFLLRGPNTDWNAAMTLYNSTLVRDTFAPVYKPFCFNCHDPLFAYDNTTFHRMDMGGFCGPNCEHRYVPCQACHAAVPHGGPRPGMLIAPAGTGAGISAYIDWDKAAPYGMAMPAPSGIYPLYIVSYPQAGTAWDGNNCGCAGAIHIR